MTHKVNNSRRIVDAQEGLHQNLLATLQKHLDKPFKKPIAEHTLKAFESIKPSVASHLKDAKPLLLDSCCGTAMSTRLIAEENPNALVIGVDRSAVRLGKEYNAQMPDNALIVQAECGDFWTLAQAEGWKLSQHTLFYPNPYPKSKHLKRRWHGHPAFPALLALGGEVELRTNWKVYADEFCMAIHFAKEIEMIKSAVEVFHADSPKTLFEKKYQENGQELYRCRFSL